MDFIFGFKFSTRAFRQFRVGLRGSFKPDPKVKVTITAGTLWNFPAVLLARKYRQFRRLAHVPFPKRTADRSRRVASNVIHDCICTI